MKKSTVRPHLHITQIQQLGSCHICFILTASSLFLFYAELI